MRGYVVTWSSPKWWPSTTGRSMWPYLPRKVHIETCQMPCKRRAASSSLCTYCLVFVWGTNGGC
eukprot:scaffold260587_cov37-Tisochrysis_lutea.AAC.1